MVTDIELPRPVPHPLTIRRKFNITRMKIHIVGHFLVLRPAEFDFNEIIVRKQKWLVAPSSLIQGNRS